MVDDDTSSREEDNLETAAANELETQYISDSPNEKKEMTAIQRNQRRMLN